MTSTPSLAAASVLAVIVAASGSAAAATITPRNAPDGAGNFLFPVDSGTGALGFYVAYEASGLTPAAPYSMRIVVPPGQSIAIDDHEPACYNLDFEPGETRTVFFFLNYIGPAEPRGTVATDQRIDVELYGTSDCTGAVIDRLETSNNTVVEAIGANANRIAVVTVPAAIVPDVSPFRIIAEPDPNDIIPLTPTNYISSGAQNLKTSMP